MQEWWTDFYDEVIADILLCHDPVAIEKNADFILDLFRLAGRSIIFDQCSGQGDLSLAFAKRGMQTVGVDQATKYVEAAREKVRAQNVDCHFEVGDANRFVTRLPCDAAVNWHTSFGYSAYDCDNIQMLQCAYDSLRPGGQYVLDYLFPTAIVKNFQPRREYQSTKSNFANAASSVIYMPP
jgi:SAM-dependent methyltransferase